MITFPNAKINLGLNIVERRPDGYHNIETVFVPIPWSDILEIVPAKAGKPTTLTTYGIPVNCPPEKNLVMKAARLMQQQYDVPELEIHLTKVVPHGAGLGGGSADAAFTLTMINEIFDLGIKHPQLAETAQQLGADCPFFIYNKPMLATGIGDILSPIEVDLTRMGLFLVKPDVLVPTAEAYSNVTPSKPDSRLIDDIKAPVTSWQKSIKNDFETSVFKLHPQLQDIKSQLLENCALYAAMSGSGSTIFGIFESVNMAEKMKGRFDCECDFVTAL